MLALKHETDIPMHCKCNALAFRVSARRFVDSISPVDQSVLAVLAGAVTFSERRAARAGLRAAAGGGRHAAAPAVGRLPPSADVAGYKGSLRRGGRQTSLRHGCAHEWLSALVCAAADGGGGGGAA